MDEQKKQIRFISSNYDNLFTVPDGGNVVINRYDGERVVLPCKYEDETHATIGNYLYHICEFAEKMEAAGNTYEPEIPEKVEGYIIVTRVDFSNRTGVVLGYNPDAAEPYATWETKEIRGEREYRDGRYRKRLSTAERDFDERKDKLWPTNFIKVVYVYSHTENLPKQPGKVKKPKAQDDPVR